MKHFQLRMDDGDYQALEDIAKKRGLGQRWIPEIGGEAVKLFIAAETEAQGGEPTLKEKLYFDALLLLLRNGHPQVRDAVVSLLETHKAKNARSA